MTFYTSTQKRTLAASGYTILDRSMEEVNKKVKSPLMYRKRTDSSI